MPVGMTRLKKAHHLFGPRVGGDVPVLGATPRAAGPARNRPRPSRVCPLRAAGGTDPTTSSGICAKNRSRSPWALIAPILAAPLSRARARRRHHRILPPGCGVWVDRVSRHGRGGVAERFELDDRAWVPSHPVRSVWACNRRLGSRATACCRRRSWNVSGRSSFLPSFIATAPGVLENTSTSVTFVAAAAVASDVAVSAGAGPGGGGTLVAAVPWWCCRSSCTSTTMRTATATPTAATRRGPMRLGRGPWAWQARRPARS